MNATFFAGDGQLWQVAGWTMVHFLWIGALVALLAVVCRVLLRRAPANVRYGAMLVCFVLLAMLPVGIAAWVVNYDVVTDSASVVPGELRPEESIELSQADASATIELNPLSPDYDGGVVASPSIVPPTLDVAESGAETALPAAAAGVTTSPLTPNAPWQSQELPDALVLLVACVPYLPWVWIVGAPATFLMLVTGVIGAKRLERASSLIESGPIVDTLEKLKASMRVSRRVAVAVCERIVAPVLVGIVRPMILLPPSALTGWTPDEIEMVLLHELAHVRQWDNLVNLVQRIVESLLFFHPAVWLVSTWVRREREACCDAVVVRHTERPRAYAEMLVGFASMSSEPGRPRPRFASAVVSSAMAAGPLRSRIRRILQVEEDPMLVSGRSLVVVMGALVVATLGVLYLPTLGQAEESSAEDAVSESEATNDEMTDDVAAALESYRQAIVAYDLGFDSVFPQRDWSPRDETRLERYPTREAWPSVLGHVDTNPEEFRVVREKLDAEYEKVTGPNAYLAPLSWNIGTEGYATLLFLNGIKADANVVANSYTSLASFGPMGGDLFFDSYATAVIDGDMSGQVTANSYFNLVVTGKFTGKIFTESYAMIYLMGGFAGEMDLENSKVVIGGRTAKADLARIAGSGKVYLEESDLAVGKHQVGQLEVTVGGMADAKDSAGAKDEETSDDAIDYILWQPAEEREAESQGVAGKSTTKDSEKAEGKEDRGVETEVGDGDKLSDKAKKDRVQSTNNLKDLMLALLNYDATYKRFPAHASYSADGQPLLSWRVHLLPFIEGGAKLYEEFHLDEPWDSPHNIELVKRTPDVFKNPGIELAEGETSYLAVVGDDCVFDGSPNGTQFRHLVDGAFKTIALVEANATQAVEWTKPEDFEYVAQRPKRGLGAVRAEGWLAAFADGSVSLVSNDAKSEELRADFERSDGYRADQAQHEDAPMAGDLGAYVDSTTAGIPAMVGELGAPSIGVADPLPRQFAGPATLGTDPTAASLPGAEMMAPAAPERMVEVYEITAELVKDVKEWTHYADVRGTWDGERVIMQAPPMVHEELKALLAATEKWRAPGDAAERASLPVVMQSRKGEPRLQWTSGGLTFGEIPRERWPNGKQPGGVEVIAVAPGSPAAWQNIRPGDMLISVAGLEMASVAELESVLSNLLKAFKGNRDVELQFHRTSKSGQIQSQPRRFELRPDEGPAVGPREVALRQATLEARRARASAQHERVRAGATTERRERARVAVTGARAEATKPDGALVETKPHGEAAASVVADDAAAWQAALGKLSDKDQSIAERASTELDLKVAPASEAELEPVRKQGLRGGLKLFDFDHFPQYAGPMILTQIQSKALSRGIVGLEDLKRVLDAIESLPAGSPIVLNGIAKNGAFNYSMKLPQRTRANGAKSEQAGTSSPDRLELGSPADSDAGAIAEFPHAVRFEKGASQFAPGDRITVLEIRGTAETFEPGNMYWIRGKYTLASRDKAALSAFVTAKDAAHGKGPVLPIQTTQVNRGQGTFELVLPMSHLGWPHVSFYPAEGGNGFGGIYFGTSDSVLKHWWGNDDVADQPLANPPPGERVSRFPSLEEQKLADLAWKRLGLELESIEPEDLAKVKAFGFEGGVKVAATSQIGQIEAGDVLVGLHVWPTTSLEDVAAVLDRNDVQELSPLKFYVVKTNRTKEGKLFSGRIQVNAPARPTSKASKLSPADGGGASSMAPRSTASGSTSAATSTENESAQNQIAALSAKLEQVTALRDQLDRVLKSRKFDKHTTKQLSISREMLDLEEEALAADRNRLAEGSERHRRPSNDAEARRNILVSKRDSLAAILPHLKDQPEAEREFRKGIEAVNRELAQLDEEGPTASVDAPTYGGVTPTRIPSRPPDRYVAPYGANPPARAPVGTPVWSDSSPNPTSAPVTPWGTSTAPQRALPVAPSQATPTPAADWPQTAAEPNVTGAPTDVPVLHGPPLAISPSPSVAAPTVAEAQPNEPTPAALDPGPQAEAAARAKYFDANRRLEEIDKGRGGGDGERFLLIEQRQQALEEWREATKAIRTNKSALRYDGKRFEEWATLWRTELSNEKRAEAVKAFAAFARAGFGKEAVEAILDVAGEYDFYILQGTSDPEGRLKEAVLDMLAPPYQGHSLAEIWVPELAGRLKADPEKWKWLMAHLLGRVTIEDESVIATLEELAVGGPKEVRGESLSALVRSARSRPGMEGRLDDTIRKLLAPVLENGNPSRVIDAMHLLLEPGPYSGGGMGGGMGPTPTLIFIPELVPLLFHTDENVQRQTRSVLRYISKEDAPPAVKQLLSVLEDQSRSGDHIAAMRALAAMGGSARESIPVLQEVLKQSDDRRKLVAALVAWQNIVARKSANTDIAITLLQGRDELDFQVFSEEEEKSLFERVGGRSNLAGGVFQTEAYSIFPQSEPGAGGGMF